jgi:N-acetylneuraminic acid mutarotase
MKYFFLFFFALAFVNTSLPQQLPDLPIPIGAGACEVWHSSIYHFGGSNNWAGSICYPSVYRFDGTEWNYYDSIPDYNIWGVTSVLVGDNVFLLGAWPYGPQLNRKYDLNNRTWEYLAESPNTYHTGESQQKCLTV